MVAPRVPRDEGRGGGGGSDPIAVTCRKQMVSPGLTWEVMVGMYATGRSDWPQSHTTPLARAKSKNKRAGVSGAAQERRTAMLWVQKAFDHPCPVTDFYLPGHARCRNYASRGVVTVDPSGSPSPRW